jgi:hypothetical protein
MAGACPIREVMPGAAPAPGPSAPPLIKAAVLLVLAVLFDRPGDDPLMPGVKNILHRYRDPAIA